MLKPFQDWFEKHQSELRDQYFRFLRFRSVSTEPEFKSEVDACAAWVQNYLKGAGFHAEVVQTVLHPIVLGENRDAGAGKPTLLIYGHYDVQPVDPIDLWVSDPFTPTERDGKIFARGAVDDKGQIFFAMAALKCFRDLGKRLPINVKFCIEGEEEAGSMGLSSVLPKIKEKIRADYLMVVDYDSYDAEVPAINLGARGLVSMDVTLTGSNGDLHSGICGGVAYNPLRAMSELLAQLYDENGRVAVDGFYDGVEEPSELEKKTFHHQHERAYYTKHFGIEAFGGEKGRSVPEANVFRPTLEINGIGGGYSGAGFKTVIPAKVVAKISCRLVPGQDPEKVGQKVASFLKKKVVKGMKLDVQIHGGAAAYRGNPHSRLARAIAAASEEVMGEPCRPLLSGASVPIIGDLSRAAGADVVGMGYGLPTDQIHAPNEHFDFKRLERGFLTVARAIELI